MKNKWRIYSWIALMLIGGVISLISISLDGGELVVAFQELPRTQQIASTIAISLMGIVTLVSAILLLIFLLRTNWALSIRDALNDCLERPRVRFVLVTLLLIVSFVSGQILLQIVISDNVWGIFFIWLFLTSFLSQLLLIAGKNSFRVVKKPDVYIPIMIAFFIMILLGLLNGSKYGFNESYQPGIEGVFRLTGFPILDYQVLLSWIAVVGGFFFLRWIVKKWGKEIKFSALVVDILIVSSLFIGSFLISNSTPVVPNTFIDRPRPPNYTISPNLDAEIYERTAQSLLASGKMQTYIGEGDYLTIARRPLLALYLAGLHWVAGLGHDDILTLQLLFFSLVPVLIYLFTKTLHNRISAVLAAVLMVFRHQNGLLLAHNVWGGTNLHMLMSEFPAIIIVILFLILSIIWIKNFSENSLFPIILGGILGLGMLIRQEVLVFLPVVSIISLLGRKPRIKVIFTQFFLLFMSTVVVITPWIYRNWVNSGKVYLDKPGNRIEKIFRTFNSVDGESSITEEDILPAIDETNILPITPSSPVISGNQFSRIQLIGNHYANALPQLFLYLPSNPLGLNPDFLQKMANGKLVKQYGGVLYSPYKYAKSLPYWWFDQWDGKIDSKSWIYLSGVVALVSLGIYSIWKKERWITFVPLLAIFGMISIYAVSLSSGGRLMQTVDWFSAMFLSIGLVEVSSRTLDWWGSNRLKTHPLQKPDILKEYNLPTLSSGMVILIYLGTVIIGALPVIAEKIIPNNYTESEIQVQLGVLLDNENQTFNSGDRDLLFKFVDQGGEVIYGRALYPRYFPPDAELMTTNQRLFPSSTTFTIAGTELNYVVLPTLMPPESFPHGSDVLVFGCREVSFLPDPELDCLGCYTDGFDALAVIQLNEDNQVEDVLWRDGQREDNSGCPLNWPNP